LKKNLAQSEARPILAQVDDLDLEECEEPVPPQTPEPEPPAPTYDCEDELAVDLDWCPAEFGENEITPGHAEVVR